MKAILLFVLAFALTGCASEFNVVELMAAVQAGSVETYLHGLLVGFVANNPTLSVVVAGVTVLMPALAWVASNTANPVDNVFYIALNKLLQLVTSNSSKNQPDVLSLKDMVTHWPSEWSELLQKKMADKGQDVYKRAIERSFKSLQKKHPDLMSGGSFQR